MGYYCWLCRRERPHEYFRGRGEAARLCRDCRKLPKAERRTRQALDDLSNFLKQSHISEKNVARLRELAHFPDPEVASRADLILEIALLKPYKRKRLRALARERPDLMERLREKGLIEPLPWTQDSEPPVDTIEDVHLPEEDPELALKPEQEAELDRRCADYLADPEAALPWEEVRRTIEKRT